MRPSIDLPRVFDSQDPRLAYGFVTLAKLFAAVDEEFITAWTNYPVHQGAGISQQSSQSIAKLLRHEDIAGVLSVAEMDETQRLDILVTQHWLRILACQLRKEISPHCTASQDGCGPCLHDGLNGNTDCVLNTSRSLLGIISSATPATLESHGIGMVCKTPSTNQSTLLQGGLVADNCLIVLGAKNIRRRELPVRPIGRPRHERVLQTPLVCPGMPSQPHAFSGQVP